VKYLNTTDAN